MKSRTLTALTGAIVIAAGSALAQSTVTTTTTQPNTGQQQRNGAAGMLGGAAAGAAVGGPIGAAVGAAVGAAGGVLVTPPNTVTTYVEQHPVQSVVIPGEVTTGVVLPDTVTLTPVPDTQYAYVYSNGQPVIVNPSSRKVVQVLQ